MKPYYSDEGIVIYHGDCRDILPSLPDGCADLVLTDPPYSEAIHAGARTTAPGSRDLRRLIDFASIEAAEVQAFFGLLARLASRWLVSFLDWRHISSLEASPPPGLRFVRFGIWDKPNGAPQFSGDRPSAGWEAIALLHRDRGRMHWHGGGHRALWRYPKENGPHPTMKPEGLVRTLIQLFGDPGGLVLDPFMGSGQTLLAARREGRPAIGIECEESYCELAAKRVDQRVLPFVPVPAMESRILATRPLSCDLFPSPE